MPRKPKPDTLPMFPAGDDLPLFSGVSPLTLVRVFKPEASSQPKLFAPCPICLGTGLVITRRHRKPIKCPCQLPR